MITMLLLSLLTQDVCKTTPLDKGAPAPCAGILIDKSAAESTYDIVENQFPKALTKISLLEQSLTIDNTIIADLKSEIVILKKDVKDLLDFSKTSVLDYDKAQKMQSVIIGVTAIAAVVGTVLVVIAVGYAVRGFAPTTTIGQVLP